MGKKTYVIATVDNDAKPSFVDNQDRSTKKPITLLTNTHRAIIRIAKLTKQEKRLTSKIKWRLVQENFPLGILLNENTHYFDGCIFTNATGERIFLMVALPKNISQAITDMALEEWGSIHRITHLGTLEDLLFRQYTQLEKNHEKETPHAQWIVFPQDEGFRILHINNGLPGGAYYISNREGFREAELARVWEIASTQSAVMLDCDEVDIGWIKESLPYLTTIETGIKYPSIIGL